jgi:hypothetical protein
MKKLILVLICTHLLPWLVMPAAAQDQADRLAAQVEAFTKLEPHTEVVSGVDPSVLDPFIGVFKGTFQDFEIAKNGDKYQLLQDSKLTKPGADPAPANIANTKEGWFIVTEGPNKGALGELLKDPSGELNYLRFNHRIFIRSDAVPGSKALK